MSNPALRIAIYGVGAREVSKAVYAAMLFYISIGANRNCAGSVMSLGCDFVKKEQPCGRHCYLVVQQLAWLSV